MSAFEDVHRDRIAGSLAMFDRMIFKGRVTSLYKQDGARAFLWSQGVPITEFTAYAKATTERIANAARMVDTLDALAGHLSRQRGEPAKIVVWGTTPTLATRARPRPRRAES